MNTTYFANLKNITSTNIVSIALKTIPGFKGREYKALAPTWWILQEYKQDRDVDKYISNYTAHVLNTLDPYQVYLELGEDAVLCCYEKRDDFCHRHLVARWLEHNLNIRIIEL